MVVTLTKGSEIFTFGEGHGETISVSIGASLDGDAMPLSTPDAAFLYDFNGTRKVITFKGSLINDGTNHLNIGTAITVNEQRQWLEKILDGNQSIIYFDSNYTSTWDGATFGVSPVMINNISFEEQTGRPEELPFTIEMWVGS